ncbi:MAG TPA: phage protease [Phycisphaerae bacterium]|nr:phage protease [Phycisphaerae bacterium]
MTDCEVNMGMELREDLRVALEARPLSDAAVARIADARAAKEKAPVPHRVMIVPWGEVQSSAGAFMFDDDAAAETLAAFAAHGTDLPVDYEHQTLGGEFSSPNGQAPAAGWITGLVPVSPEQAGSQDMPAQAGLWANVTWTDDGSERLANREYRYLSPVALVRKTDGRLVGLHSAALTNKPAIVGMRPVVNRDRLSAGELSATTHLLALRIALSLDEGADDAAVLRTAVGRLRALENAEFQRRAEARVAEAMSAGKLTASQRDWAYGLALRDPSEFDRWAADAPRVVAMGRMMQPLACGGAARAARGVVESAARMEWRTNRQFLERICSEDAYAAAARRE